MLISNITNNSKQIVFLQQAVIIEIQFHSHYHWQIYKLPMRFKTSVAVSDSKYKTKIALYIFPPSRVKFLRVLKLPPLYAKRDFISTF